MFEQLRFFLLDSMEFCAHLDWRMPSKYKLFGLPVSVTLVVVKNYFQKRKPINASSDIKEV